MTLNRREPLVVQSSMTEQQQQLRNLKEDLLALQAKKRLIEDVMEECMDRLRSVGCLNDDPLVDREGFPRADIDIISVVQDRKQLRVRAGLACRPDSLTHSPTRASFSF